MNLNALKKKIEKSQYEFLKWVLVRIKNCWIKRICWPSGVDLIVDLKDLF